jgi:hypothetical protein
MMTAEQNKAIFLRFIDETLRDYLAIIDDIHSPDFAFHWPNWPRGIEGARKLATYGRKLYRDAHVTIGDIIAENDRVAVRWTITGTWIGPQSPGSPRYGQKVAVGSMSWYRFVEGKIIEDWGTEVFWPSGTPESEIGEWHGNR